MTRSRSPLRYPGGKSSLSEMVGRVLDENELRRSHYLEPYAGGASLALNLLFSRQVSDIHLNDIDAGIYSFWFTVLNEIDWLRDKIVHTEISIEEWHKQRDTYRKHDASDPLSLGFATFFLNRTNRSGVIGSGGVIGGLNQNGNYKIDCRFNRRGLVERIEAIHRYRRSIHLSHMDAIQFLTERDEDLSDRAFFMIDPPYYRQGSSLYTNFYNAEDHIRLAKNIAVLRKPWIITYDNCEPISSLYLDFRQFPFGIPYSVNEKRIGRELMILSSDLRFSGQAYDQLTRWDRDRAAA